jgi:hypothetical protein
LQPLKLELKHEYKDHIDIKTSKKFKTMDTVFTLETQMGKPAPNGGLSLLFQKSPVKIISWLTVHAPILGPKDPLRVKLMREIGRYGVMGRPTG